MHILWNQAKSIFKGGKQISHVQMRQQNQNNASKIL